MELETISFIIGSIMLVVSILGGGIEIKEIKIPQIGRVSRGLSGALGIAFVVIGLWAGGLFKPQEPVEMVASSAQVPTKTLAKAPEESPQPSKIFTGPKTSHKPSKPIVIGEKSKSVSTSKNSDRPKSIAKKPAVPVQPPLDATAVEEQKVGKVQKKITSKSVAKKESPDPDKVFTQSTPKSNKQETKTTLQSKSQGTLEPSSKKLAGASVPGAEQADAGTISFTIKARLGNLGHSKEIESAMRIYLGGKKMANFNLSLREPSQSVSAKLKPGKYKYYIEGVSLWDSKTNPPIPMEGSGVIVVTNAGVFEVWAETAPGPQMKVWEVKLKEK